jgi:hypothetical protein
VERNYKRHGRKEKCIQDFVEENVQSIKLKICTSTILSLSYMGTSLDLSSKIRNRN